MFAAEEFVSTSVKITKRRHKEVGDHFHDYFELAFVLNGNALHSTESETKRVSKGNYFFIDYGDRHRYEKGDEDFEIINCLFLPEFLDGSLSGCKSFREIAECFLVRFQYDGLNSIPVNHIFFDEDGVVRDLFIKMLDIYEKKEIGYAELIRCYLIEVIVFTLRKLSKRQYMSEKDERVEKIRAEIEKRYKEDISLCEICSELHFSLPYISRLFKKETGETFSDFLQKTRVRNACHLLARTVLPVEKIAEEVGYKDTKHFRTVFRKKMNACPLKYRKEYRSFL